MTELERFAVLVLMELRASGLRPESALDVATLLDRTVPYKVARRILPLASVEDYELLALRLIAEEGRLVMTAPTEAAEMARATLASRIPDLDVLRLLRGATLTFTDDAIGRLDGVTIHAANTAPAAEVAPQAEPPAAFTSPPEPVLQTPIPGTTPASVRPVAAEGCWACGAPAPTGRTITFCVACGADQRPPMCGSCGVAVERAWKHCPDCGERLGGGKG